MPTGSRTMTTAELLECSALDAFGMLDAEESAAFERAIADAPAEVRAGVLAEQSRAMGLWTLLPDVKPDPALRDLVLAAVRESIEGHSAASNALGAPAALTPALALSITPARALSSTRWMVAAARRNAACMAALAVLASVLILVNTASRHFGFASAPGAQPDGHGIVIGPPLVERPPSPIHGPDPVFGPIASATQGPPPIEAVASAKDDSKSRTVEAVKAGAMLVTAIVAFAGAASALALLRLNRRKTELECHKTELESRKLEQDLAAGEKRDRILAIQLQREREGLRRDRLARLKERHELRALREADPQAFRPTPARAATPERPD